jgi:hypothetical protein
LRSLGIAHTEVELIGLGHRLGRIGTRSDSVSPAIHRLVFCHVDQHHESTTTVLFDVVIFRVVRDVAMY